MTCRSAHLIARELRIEARGPNLSRERCWASLCAAGIIFWSIATPPFASLSDRWYLSFLAVAVLGAGLALLAGMRHVTRALGDEIRTGTLELLLGTKVTIPEFVFGSFMARFLHALCELLPLLPLLLLCAAMSGSSVLEFWRVVSAWLAILFTSLALAMLAAAFSRDERPALSATLILVVGIAVWVPLAALLTETISLAPTRSNPLVLASPAVTFRKALNSEFQRDPEGFYRSLVFQFCLGTTALVAAGFALRQRFRCQSLVLRSYFFSAKFRAGKTNRPGSRFAPDPRAWAIHHWALSLIPILVAGAVIFSLRNRDRVACELSLAALYGAHLNLKLGLALEASSGLREARRLGNLLPELAASISVAELLERHKAAVRRQFRWPCLSMLLAHGAVLAVVGLQHQSPLGLEEKLAVAVVLLIGLIALFTDGYALLWFGMWSGLMGADGGRALVRTLGRIVFLPWAALWVLVVPNFGILFTMNEGAAYFVCWTVFGISLSLIAGASSKYRLHRELRSRAGCDC